MTWKPTNSKNLLRTLLQTCHTYRREGGIFLLLFLTLLCTLPSGLHGWNSAWYAMDYSLGLDSRLFIGSLLRLFHPDYLTAEAAYAFVLFSTLLFLLLLSIILGSALRHNASSPAGGGLLFLTALYLLCPGSPAYLWTTENIGRFDLYLILLTLLAVVIYLKLSNVCLRLAAFTLIGLAAVSIHPVYMFVFFPLLFVLFADTMAEGRRKKAVFLSGGICLLLICGAFFYYQFFSHIQAASLEALTARLTERTSLPVNEVALRYEYFSDFSTPFRELMLNELPERIRYGIVTLFLLLPLGAVYGWLWKQLLSGPRTGRLKYLLILLSQAAFIPAFLLTIDWGRWFGAFLTVQALQIIVLAAKKDAWVLTALQKLSSAIHRHPYLFIAILLWMAALSKFQATLLPDAPVFFSSLYQLYRTIF